GDAKVEYDLALAHTHEPDARFALLMDMLFRDVLTQDVAGIRRCATESTDLAARVGRADFTANALVAAAVASHTDGQPDQCAAALGRSAALKAPRARLPLAFACLAFYHLGLYEEAELASRETVQSAERFGDAATLGFELASLGSVLAARGRYGDALTAFA